MVFQTFFYVNLVNAGNSACPHETLLHAINNNVKKISPSSTEFSIFQKYIKLLPPPRKKAEPQPPFTNVRHSSSKPSLWKFGGDMNAVKDFCDKLTITAEDYQKSKEAFLQTLKKKRKELMKKLHPDKKVNLSPKDLATCQEINQAYDYLKATVESCTTN